MQRFNTVFATTHHYYLFLATWTQSTPWQPISLTSMSILSSLLCLGPPKWCFPLNLPIKIFMHVSCLQCVVSLHVTPTSSFHFIILIIFGEEYTFCSSSICSFLQTAVTSFLIGSNVLFGVYVCVLSLFLYVITQDRQQLPGNCCSHSVRSWWDVDVH